jgi:hypothetical protein
MTAAGLNPEPIRLGGGTVLAWSRRELLRWIDAKCPPRCEWGSLHAELLRRGRAR